MYYILFGGVIWGNLKHCSWRFVPSICTTIREYFTSTQMFPVQFIRVLSTHCLRIGNGAQILSQ